MKFTANRKELLEALTLTGKAINKSVVAAVMGYRFNINQNRLTVTGGNMETYIHNTIEIQGDVDKSIIVPKDKIFNLLKELNDPQLEFSITISKIDKLEAIRLIITAQSGKYNIPVDSGDDYPGFLIDNTVKLSVKPEDLSKGIDKTLFACSSDDGMPALTSVFLNITDGRATYISCNTNVLSAQTIGGTSQEETLHLLLPKNSAAILKDLPFDSDVEIEIAANAVNFKLWDGLELQTALIDAKFPDYKAITPVDNDKHMHIDRKQLMASIKRVTMFSNEQSNSIALKFYDKTVQVLVNNDDDGTAIETLTADYVGEPITMGFNGKFLLSALDKIDSDVVYADFSTQKKALLLHDGNINLKTKENYMLIMPVLLSPKLANVS